MSFPCTSLSGSSQCKVRKKKWTLSGLKVMRYEEMELERGPKEEGKVGGGGKYSYKLKDEKTHSSKFQ